MDSCPEHSSLLTAIWEKDLPNVKLLLQNKADVNQMFMNRSTHLYVLHFAMSAYNTSIVNALLESKADVDAVDNRDGWNCLHALSTTRNLELSDYKIPALFHHLLFEKNNHNETPLQHVVSSYPRGQMHHFLKDAEELYTKQLMCTLIFCIPVQDLVSIIVCFLSS